MRVRGDLGGKAVRWEKVSFGGLVVCIKRGSFSAESFGSGSVVFVADMSFGWDPFSQRCVQSCSLC